MTYKTYKIINKVINQDKGGKSYIGFVLDGNVEFRNGKQDFIFCANEHPFTNYRVGEEIEINLVGARRLETNNYHHEVVRAKYSRNIPIDDYSSWQQDEERRQLQQLQKQKQESLNKMKLGLDTFYNILEPLEEYIEKSGDFPGFINKRQIYRKTIQDSEGPLEDDEDLFLSNLFIFARTFHGKPSSFRKVIQEDFYKWIDAVGITAENCPEKLKHFLIEINNVLEGNDEKIVRETREINERVEINPWDMPKIFAGLQEPLRKNREQAKALKGKSWNEISEEDRLKGSAELGKIAFQQIEKSVSIPHQNFRLRGSETSQVKIVKQSPSQWRIEELVVSVSHNRLEKEWMLIRYDAKIESEFGNLKTDPGKIFSRKEFSENEWIEIQEVLNNFKKSVSPQQRTNSEIIQDVKDNPNNWRIDEVITGYNIFGTKKEEALIYHSVQLGHDGEVIGSLEKQPVYPVSRFNQEELAEINQAKNISQTLMINQQLVNNIKQNTRLERNIVVFDPESGKYSEADDWFVHNEWKNTNEVGSLVFNSDAMVRAKGLSEAEQEAVGYSKSEQRLQNFSLTPTKKDDDKISTSKVFGVIGIIGVLLFASAAIIRKRLNNKSKD